MRYLDQEKNNNFYIDNEGWLRNINQPNDFLEKCEHTPAPISYYFNLFDLKQYKTGVLVKKTDFSSQKFIFYANNGEKLFSIARNKRNNPGFMEMDAYVCDTGILVAISTLIKGVQEREYIYKYYYDQRCIKTKDFDTLKMSVEKRHDREI